MFSRFKAVHLRHLAVLAFLSTLIVFTVFWVQKNPDFSFVPQSIINRLKNLGSASKTAPVKTETKTNGAQSRVNVTHPIDDLIKNSTHEWEAVLSKRVETVRGAANAYRRRRGRHPPPNFDKWVQYALNHDAIIVEDFWDQIYNDLEPFWGSSADELRRFAKHFEHSISVREGKVSTKTDRPDLPWTPWWEKMVRQVAAYLPDVDMPINIMDETRVVAEWEDVNAHMEKAKVSRRLHAVEDVKSSFSGLKKLDEDTGESFDPQWVHEGTYFMLARNGCPPQSAFRDAEQVEDFTGPPALLPQYPNGSYHGYVQNWTYVKDACHQPELRDAHGTFIEPLSISTTHRLIPLFGGFKLSMNNEILLPPAIYYSDIAQYTGGDNHGGDWSSKKDMVLWRGDASGGRHKAETWTRWHRHRFVNMLNGTAVEKAEQQGTAPNFYTQPYHLYKLVSMGAKTLGSWLSDFIDVGFTAFSCFPGQEDGLCSYTDPYFERKAGMPMKDMYNYKYLPDLDGNSYSGRWWAFLLSTSLPIKATLYTEWHSSRLKPWLHFVPMHMSFMDIYGILDYFHGSGTPGDGTGHDEEAEKIAMEGKAWAEKVLRREDMEIYVFRLLLEFARLCDDHREQLGYVGDLLED